MKSVIKFLTFILLSIGHAFPVAVQDQQPSHLRWKIKAEKQQVKISKKSNKVFIQSLDPEFFEKFTESVVKFPKQSNYIIDKKFTEPSTVGSPYKLEITLKDESIELFNFYKQENNQYILDFWINQDMIQTKKAAVKENKNKLKLAKLNKPKPKKVIKRKTPKTAAKVLTPKNNRAFKVIDPDQIDATKTKGYRDFRYGAAFVWDYDALIPPIESDVDLAKKAPDYFYEIPDMKYLDDPKQAHMQLSINFYRKQEWGLMTRSIELYQKKYPSGMYKDTNEFMKAVALIRNTINEKLKPKFKSKLDEAGEIMPPKEFSNKGIKAAAKNILSNVISYTEIYDMKKAVLRYLIQDARNQEDYIRALDYAKKLYVEGSENQDDEMIVLSSRIILNSLANLNQIDKISEFLKNKAVKRVLPAQEGFAYIDYVNLKQNKINEVIKNFNREKAGFSKPIHPSVLFNVGEAYFRKAEYSKALTLFDNFLANYSYFTNASHARLRLALAYDLLDKDPKKTLRLYQDAINKSAELKIRYEAKIRYVGYRVARKLDLELEDTETTVFLEADTAEQKIIGSNLQKLLWLTRLRTFINMKNYNDALAYLTTLPVEGLRAVDQKAFQADGAEVILGLIKNSYIKEDYARAVKVWEVYKKKYEYKVARNPYLNFIVCDSYLKLGLMKSFEIAFEDLKGIKQSNMRRYPLWVKAHKNIPVKDYVVELTLNKFLKAKDYKGLGQYLNQVKDNKNVNYKFYKGIVSYHQGQYNLGVENFESLLVSPNLNNILSPRQNEMMLSAYLESLYEVAKPERFRKNIVAITNDLRRNAKTSLKPILVRADYLYMESLFSENKVRYKLLQEKAQSFLGENKMTPYHSRVRYLRGVSLVNSNNIQEGKKILKELLDSDEVPAYIKGLARTELSTLELKNRTL